jgi:flavin reductase (DIM6/NTAB) family NADH-FMN oxidoreductase RutF
LHGRGDCGPKNTHNLAIVSPQREKRHTIAGSLGPPTWQILERPRPVPGIFPRDEPHGYDGRMQPAPEELAKIDAALRFVDREVWIITAASGTRRGGLAASWVSAASIDFSRPVLLAGIAANHFTAELVEGSKAFAAHLLRADQGELAWNFAHDSGRNRDKFHRLAVEQRETGSPILVDCLAWFDCRAFARYDAGDRIFYWADVVAAERAATTSAVLRETSFFGGLSEARNADAAEGRPRHQIWREKNAW